MKGFPNGFVWFVGNNYPIYKEHEHKSCFSSLNIDWSSVSVFFSSLLSASMGLVGGWGDYLTITSSLSTRWWAVTVDMLAVSHHTGILPRNVTLKYDFLVRKSPVRLPSPKWIYCFNIDEHCTYHARINSSLCLLFVPCFTMSNTQCVFESSCPISILNSMVVVWIVLSVSQVPLCRSSKRPNCAKSFFTVQLFSTRLLSALRQFVFLWSDITSHVTPPIMATSIHIYPPSTAMLARPYRPGSHQAWVLA